jgi:hypothetical protein
MTLDLDDYREAMQDAGPAVLDALDSVYQEASRVMSPAGLHDYLEGAKGLTKLGRGHDIVISYLEEMPAVAKECGEDIIRDVIEAAMKLSSMTSGEVIALLFSTMPTAARRLGDPELLRGYLAFVHQLSAKAARGLRPMLNHMEELLSKLTLSGLKRWAFFGAEAYRRDFENLQAYFNLETTDSRAMLQKQRRGTLFIDTQRKLNFYLRALWGRDFFLRPTATDYEGFKPYIEHRVLHMPDAVDPLGEVQGLEVYRATAAHMAAHVVYTRQAISAEQLSQAQMFFIGLLEDARVEYNAVQAFPGLKRLWRALLEMEYSGSVEHETVPKLERLALMLLDEGVTCGDAELDAFAARFHAEIDANRENEQFSWHMGVELFNLFAARREVPSLRILQGIRVPYRDDNRYVWEFEEFDWRDDVEYVPASQRQVRRQVSISLRGRGGQLQRDVGQGARLRSVPLPGVGLPGAAAPARLGHGLRATPATRQPGRGRRDSARAQADHAAHPPDRRPADPIGGTAGAQHGGRRRDRPQCRGRCHDCAPHGRTTEPTHHHAQRDQTA